ncbi:type II toxin-antitoxin system YhaV family toxin [Falsiroseomonas bella]|uniref:type II toxin-antitoxin system YhaV family toxin n=1 Tax=Falsiroseomonas bella TaxID=2184016 RepID=UPI001E43872E|nr:type II toxin-antitoxin system YhaV family toxin [Falsiroseomonas bella]
MSQAPRDKKASPSLVLKRNGWHIILHPLFRDRLIGLQRDVEALRQADPDGWESRPQAKLLKRVVDLVLTEIPRDPAAAEFEQGATLGRDAQGWRRAKFLGRFRLFFRFHSASKVIAIAWVNDENTLRKAGASSDPYAVFRGMLVRGNPPSGWEALVEACRMAPDDPARTVAQAALGRMEVAPDLALAEPAVPAASKRKKRR